MILSNAIDELISTDESGVFLGGSRCVHCGEVVFPALTDCPLCAEPNVMEPHRLFGHGTLRDYVLAERGPEGFDVPYIQAWVTLDDGPVIYSTIVSHDPRNFDAEKDSPVTMVLAQFGSGDRAFTGWKFTLDGDRHE